MTTTSPDQLNAQCATLEPKQILEKAAEHYGQPLLSFSGAEDVVLIDMAHRLGWKPRVVTLDTGRLHPETYRFLEEVRSFYKIDIELLFPEAAALKNLIQTKGLFSFYEDGHEECCSIRKVAPLRQRLASETAWVTGRRRDQSPSRAEVAVVEADPQFEGATAPLVKVNPLANWSSEQVWGYIRLMELPYNELHDLGFISIGCEPCTRSVGPNQHEREGRWWWEEVTMKECGLHLGTRPPR